MPTRQRHGAFYIRALLVTILLFAAAATLLSAFAPIGPEAERIGSSGLLSVLDVREEGNVGEDPESVAGDNTLNIVAVPFIYNTTNEQGQERLQGFRDYMDYLEGNLSERTPFSEANDPGSHIEIIEVERGYVENPDPSSEGGVMLKGTRYRYEAVTCGDIHSAASTAAGDAGLFTYADKIVAFVNGTKENGSVTWGNPIVLEDAGTVGCADSLGGDVAAYERSIIQNEWTSGVGLHELGHTVGLCHNAGVEDENGNCDMSRVPDRPSVCSGLNSNTSDGPRAIMNYCLPLDKFSGDRASTEDEYPLLEQIFTEQGWLYAE